MKNSNALKISLAAMFAAVISISGFFKIPLGPVPVVLQNVVCLLCAVLTGGILAATPVALFLVAGLIGLPVFSGGTSGLAVFAGPTGGFLIGYLTGSIMAGIIAGTPSVEEKKITSKTVVKITVAVLAGLVLMYIPGVIHFSKWAEHFAKVPENTTAFKHTLKVCVLPFIPGDIIKSIIAVITALKVRPVLASYLYSGKKGND